MPSEAPLSSELVSKIDNAVRARVASLTGGISPVSAATAWADWAMHMALSPGKQAQLAASGVSKVGRFARFAIGSLVGQQPAPAAELPPHDRRFSSDAWHRWPFSWMSQSFLLSREWWTEATADVDGLSEEHQALVAFLTLQAVDAMSPFNMPLTNADVVTKTVQSRGRNMLRGIGNLVADVRRRSTGAPPVGTEEFVVGQDLACSPGKVIYRNRLMELIQYAPTTDKVVREPLLFVPPWIMKYYVLDLSPRNSMVRYLVSQGHTVFMISWKNPDQDDRDLDLDDYGRLGVLGALDVIGKLLPGTKINAAGYCAGGTLLAIVAAALARDGDQRLNSVTTFTAQTDCTEPGAIKVFLNQGQLAIIREKMARVGYLDGSAFAASFNALNVNDLVWKPIVDRYLNGEEAPLIDLMAWNKDLTRVPYKTHYRWLKEIFIENALAEDRYAFEDETVHLSDLRAPLCFVATTTDHVAPWKSVYKIHRLAPNAELTFVLTNGGHNAGIACGAEHPRRKHQIATRAVGDGFVSADAWARRTATVPGSWWPAWDGWLKARSTAERVAPPALGDDDQFAPLADAPGTYVMMR